MVVRVSLHLRVLVLAMLFATADLAVAQFVPATLPCVPEQTLKFSGPTKPKQVSVKIGERTLTQDFDISSGKLTIHLVPETDCNKTLQIDHEGQHETVQISAAPAKSVQDLQQISDSVQQMSHSVQQNSSYLEQLSRDVKDLPKTSDFALWVSLVAGVAAVLAFVFALLVWLKQTEMMAMAKSSQKKIMDAVVALDPSPTYTQKLVKQILDGISSAKNASKDSGSFDQKVSKLTDGLRAVVNGIQTIEMKVDNVGKVLVEGRKVRAASSAEGIGSSWSSGQAGNESMMFPSFQEPPAARVSMPPPTSFEDAYNSAGPGMEDRLPGVVKVIAVTPRGVGDKNPNAKEPLIEDPAGELRVFIVREGNPYLAPSLETMALGIGGTYQRVWGHLFTFESREATTLTKAATVNRVGNEYEIAGPGIMS